MLRLTLMRCNRPLSTHIQFGPPKMAKPRILFLILLHLCAEECPHIISDNLFIH